MRRLLDRPVEWLLNTVPWLATPFAVVIAGALLAKSALRRRVVPGVT